MRCVYPVQRWEFIKENKKVRKKEKKSVKHFQVLNRFKMKILSPALNGYQESDKKKENKNSTKKVIKKKRKFFLFFLVVFLFS